MKKSFINLLLVVLTGFVFITIGNLKGNAQAAEPVTPKAPVFTRATCEKKGTITKTETFDVDYLLSTSESYLVVGENLVDAPGSVTVTASAGKDVELTPGVQTVWEFDFLAPVGCIKVTPLPVTFIDATCTTGGSIVIPYVDKIRYLADVDFILDAISYPAEVGDFIQVVAEIHPKAGSDYALVDGATAYWEHEFLAPAGCVLGEEVVVPPPAAVTPPAPPAPAPTTVPVKAVTPPKVTQVVAPKSAVLGAQVSVVPVGSADTGAYQKSQNKSNPFIPLALLLTLSLVMRTRSESKN
jgi:hypothetical protein